MCMLCVYQNFQLSTALIGASLVSQVSTNAQYYPLDSFASCSLRLSLSLAYGDLRPEAAQIRAEYVLIPLSQIPLF